MIAIRLEYLMLLSARLPFLLVMCLLGASRVAVAADPAEMPKTAASSASSTEPAVDKKPVSTLAVEACQAAVTDSMRSLRGSGVQRIEFDRRQPVIVPPQDEEVPLKGTGRYVNGSAKGAGVPFTYGCNYNVRTGKTNGVVISDGKDATPSRSSKRNKAAGDGTAWQPDLTRLSPEACEAAVAGVLKNKHPRVGRIAFDAQSRKLKPADNVERTLLQGQGGVQRAPGMPAEEFTYRCEFDNQSGALADVQSSD